MSNKELVKAQQFFKGKMLEEIDSYKEDFSLDIEDYDINDEILVQLDQLISSTTNLIGLSIRFSDRITDGETLTTILRKLSRKKQFKSLSFFIKYLSEPLFNIFVDFLTKMNPNVKDLQIRVKDKSMETEREYAKKIIHEEQFDFVINKLIMSEKLLQ